MVCVVRGFLCDSAPLRLCVEFLRLAAPDFFCHPLRRMKKKISTKPSRITHHASPNMRPFSSILVDGPERAAARAMLYPVGFTEEDFK